MAFNDYYQIVNLTFEGLGSRSTADGNLREMLLSRLRASIGHTPPNSAPASHSIRFVDHFNPRI
jgi:hypothetical protein